MESFYEMKKKSDDDQEEYYRMCDQMEIDAGHDDAKYFELEEKYYRDIEFDRVTIEKKKARIISRGWPKLLLIYNSLFFY